MKHNSNVIHDKLTVHFSSDISDSLIHLMNKEKDGTKLMDCSNAIKFIGLKKVNKLKKRNVRNYRKQSFIDLPNCKKAIYYYSNPIYYQNYAILQLSYYIASSNSVTNIYLLKKDNNEWKILEYLASSAS